MMIMLCLSGNFAYKILVPSYRTAQRWNTIHF